MENSLDIAIIVIHEIYGINDHITGVCEWLKRSGYDVICPNLLKLQEPFTYSQEDQAYSYFMETIGFDAASKQVKEIIENVRTKYRKLFLLGYSVGATIAWLCMVEERIDGMIGYYGTRIRDYLEIEPKNPALLIMANQEKSIRMEELLPSLIKKEKVQVHVLSGKHGFADPFSQNYDEAAELKAREIVSKFLKTNI